MEDERSQKMPDRVADRTIGPFICVRCKVLRDSLLTRLRKLLAKADIGYTQLVLFGALFRTRAMCNGEHREKYAFRVTTVSSLSDECRTQSYNYDN